MNVALWVAIVGVGGTLLAQVISVFRERGQREHERLLERERREHEERVRRSDARLSAYQRFSTLITLAVAREDVPTAEMAESYAAVDLLASEPVHGIAYELFQLAAEAMGTVGEAELENLLAKIRPKRKEFRAAIREELEGRF